MFKKDPIFWMATIIFVSGVIISGITHNQLWLFILAGSYLLRPTLASLNVGKSLIDERQMSIQYRAGNIAFAVIITTCIIMSVYLSIKEDHSWELFNAVVIIGLAAKALSNVILVGNYRDSGTKIIMAVGLLLVLFVALENGFTLGGLVESLPWLGIVGIGWLSKKYPKTIDGIIIAATVILLIIILSRGFIVGQIITAVIVSVPLVMAGISLIVGNRRGNENDPPVY
jgi:hypothetical protein